MKNWLFVVLLACAGLTQAQNPRVYLDTDRGAMLLELDSARAPLTVANFLSYVEDGSFDNSLMQRVVRDFVVQGGSLKDDGSRIARRAAIASERGNGLLNEYGTIAMALSASGGGYNYSSATSDFFINTRAGGNTSLDPDFTVFGRVIFGLNALASMNSAAVFANTQTPMRAPLIRRARVVQGFPILDLHTGAWYDPAKSGRGFGIEVGNDASSESGPLVIVYWYDYFEGRQVWMNGAANFQYGDSEVTIPMQITSGGQFGEAFDPANVVADPAWGSLTLRFTSCSEASVSYTSSYGNGSLQLQRLSLPANQSCQNN